MWGLIWGGLMRVGGAALGFLARPIARYLLGPLAGVIGLKIAAAVAGPTTIIIYGLLVVVALFVLRSFGGAFVAGLRFLEFLALGAGIAAAIYFLLPSFKSMQKEEEAKVAARAEAKATADSIARVRQIAKARDFSPRATVVGYDTFRIVAIKGAGVHLTPPNPSLGQHVCLDPVRKENHAFHYTTAQGQDSTIVFYRGAQELIILPDEVGSFDLIALESDELPFQAVFKPENVECKS